MNGFCITYAQAYALRPVGLWLFLSLTGMLIPSFLQAQTYDYYVEGDDLEAKASYESSTAIDHIVLVFQPEDYVLAAASVPYALLEDSWLCSGGNCESSLVFDAAAGKIKLELWANEARSGFGEIAYLKGIIIEPIDIDARIGGGEMAVKVYPNPAEHRILFSFEGRDADQRIISSTWVSMDGSHVKILKPGKAGRSMEVKALSRGYYHVLFETNKGIISRLIFLH
ncbi:MAG: hypothetical protein AAFR87_21325 [Bacteroidota bacterium]